MGEKAWQREHTEHISPQCRCPEVRLLGDSKPSPNDKGHNHLGTFLTDTQIPFPAFSLQLGSLLISSMATPSLSICPFFRDLTPHLVLQLSYDRTPDLSYSVLDLGPSCLPCNSLLRQRIIYFLSSGTSWRAPNLADTSLHSFLLHLSPCNSCPLLCRRRERWTLIQPTPTHECYPLGLL